MDEKQAWLTRPPDKLLSARLKKIAWGFSAVVVVLVASMERIHIDLPDGVSTAFLPPVYSAMNALAALALIAALIFIKAGKVRAHRGAVATAMVLSAGFLVLYVIYHTTNEATKFGGGGSARAIYLTLLISHIALASISLPFIFFTFISGATNHFARHKKLARWVFPVWLYVAITGPLCYLMLRPYYGGG